MRIVIKKEQIKKVFVIILSIIVFTLGILVLFNLQNLAIKISIKPVVASIYAIVISLLIKNQKTYKNFLSTSFIFLCGMAALAGFVRFDLDSFLAPVLTVISFIIFRRKLGSVNNYFVPISIAYIVSCFIIIFKFSISATNSHGLVISFLGIISLNLICFYKKDNFLLFCIVVFGILFMLILTKSRTSMLAFFVVTIVSYIYIFFSFRIPIKKLLILLLLIGVLVINMNSIETFGQSIFLNKWAGEADLTSGRQSLWIRTYDNMKLFGRGIDFLGVRSSGGLPFDAHNSFVQLIGCYGYFLIIPVFIFLCALLKGIKNSSNRILYLNFFLGWGIMSMFESLELFTSRMIPASVIFLIHLAMLTNDIGVRTKK
ncbi:MAG: O-antigen ligase family protein [Lachnospiraceae bacterium]|nr:O-antigen ligase family protein [Lachnospiraceae bacterium]